MRSHVEVIVETDTKLGELRVEEVTVYTSDDDAVANYFNVLIDGDVKHPKLSYKSAVRALGHYMGGM